MSENKIENFNDPYSDVELLSFIERMNLAEFKHPVNEKYAEELWQIWARVCNEPEPGSSSAQPPCIPSEENPTDPASAVTEAPTTLPPLQETVSPSSPSHHQVAVTPATAQSPKRSFSLGVAVGCIVGMAIGSSLTFWAVSRRGDAPRFQAERSLNSAKGRLSLAAGILEDKSRLAKFSADEISRMQRGVETGNADLLPGGLLTRQFDAPPESKGLSKQFD